MDSIRGNWASERVCNLAGRVLKVAAEKKLNYSISLDKAVLLIRYRSLKEILKLIQKKQQIKIRSLSRKEFQEELIFQEILQRDERLQEQDIRRELINTEEKEKEFEEKLKSEKRKLRQEYDNFLFQYSKLEKFLNEINGLYKKRMSILLHKAKDKEKIKIAKDKLINLFCKGISEAVDNCIRRI